MRTIDIDNALLVQCELAYNCSIVEFQNKIWMAYRYHENKLRHNTEIAIVELTSQFVPKPHTNKKLRIIRNTARVETLDDPRLFEYDGKLLCSHSQGYVSPVRNKGWTWCCHQAIAEIVPETGVSTNYYLPAYAKNLNASSQSNTNLIECEKNWSPFLSGEEGINFVYTINPLVVINYNPRTKVTKEISRQGYVELPHWAWGGFLAGGTPLQLVGNEYVGFFHSYNDSNEDKKDRRSYYVGYYAISMDKPYRLTKISKSPLIFAKPDAERDLRDSAIWKPNCVFPCGWLERNDKVYMSQGWQDCRCQVIEFTWDEILKDVIEINTTKYETKPVEIAEPVKPVEPEKQSSPSETPANLPREGVKSSSANAAARNEPFETNEEIVAEKLPETIDKAEPILTKE